MAIMIIAPQVTAAQRAMMDGMIVTREDFDQISNASGLFGDIRPSVTLTFPEPRLVSDVKNIGLLFGGAGAQIGKNIVISFLLAGQLVQQQSNINTYNLTDYGPVVTAESAGNTFDQIIIAFYAINQAGKRLRLDSVFIGKFQEFDDDDLAALQITQQIDPSVQTLPVSVASLELRPAAAGSYNFRRGDCLEISADGHQFGTYWLTDESAQIGANAWSLVAEDAIGILDRMQFPGKAYLSGADALDVVDDIIGGYVYYEDEPYTNTGMPVRGILYPQSCRSALQQVLFACGLSAFTDGAIPLELKRPAGFQQVYPEGRRYTITPVTNLPIVVLGGVRYKLEKIVTLDYLPVSVRIILTDADGNETTEVHYQSEPVSRGGVTGYIVLSGTGFTLMRGENSPSYFFPDDTTTQYTAVQVLPADTPQTKTVSADNVYLDPRIKSVKTPTKISVTAHGYYADATGSIVIEGRKYSDAPIIVSKADGSDAATIPDEVAVAGATLVSLDQVDGAIERVSAYYSTPDKWTGRIVWTDERLGDRVQVPTRWTTHTGCLTKKVLRFSKIIAAQAEVQ